MVPYDALADSDAAVDMGGDASRKWMDDVSVVAKEAARGSANWTGRFSLSQERIRAELAQKVRGAFFLAPLVRAWRAGDARVRRAMPPLSGKDAILAAARRLAELGDDALDEDLLDAELALADPARDEEQAFAEAPGDGERPLRPEDLGLPPRLAAWLARHKGRDMRRAFGAAARAARRLVPDADGHVALGRVAGAPASASAGGARPRYAPLEERVVPLSEAAAPTPRAFEHVPPAELERREALKLEARSAEAWRRGERAEGVDPRTIDNAAVSATIKNLIAAGSRREREADLPKGAGPAGRHEPTTRVDDRTTVPSVMGVSLFANESREAEGSLPGASRSLGGEREAARGRLAGAERRAATNALLGRLPDGERPIIATRASLTHGGVVRSVTKVPRAARQATLDALTAAALVAEAEARGVAPADAFAAMDARWLAARPKTRRRAIAAGVEAEARVFEAAASAAAYRGLAASALRAVGGAAEGEPHPGGAGGANRRDVPDAEAVPETLPDELSVVPRAARNRRGDARSSRGFPSRADEAAVAVAAAFEREGLELTRRRARGVGGVAAAKKGALLQNYVNEGADRIDLRAAATPLGASVAFWAETARHADPKRAVVPAGHDARRPRRAARFLKNDDGETTTALHAAAASDALNANALNANANAAVARAVRSLIRSFLEPFLDVGTITEAFARSIETKAAAKVMRKKHDEPDASFLRRDKEKEAVKALTREYVRRGEKRAGSRKGGKGEKAGKVARVSVSAHAEADSGGTPGREPTFDFDVDDL